MLKKLSNYFVVPFLLLLSITLCSCLTNEVGIQFSVKNSSSYDLSDMVICLTGDTNIQVSQAVLEKGSSTTLTLDMTQAAQGDGSYYISCTLNNTEMSKTFGYYTNGSPLEDILYLTITDSGITASYTDS